ncbi:hypothetical protein NLG97_g9108 [Lecanicillium saksenae]|uniref:Uncharacterized protein n=1 Tax=Lecanicillium saksenae TaxID=468837 RepID=A0ACC1QJN1_9HYPO|nr:hypothetical protein NLG97_g9108 [Lecanicillium saksenae]
MYASQNAGDFVESVSSAPGAPPPPPPPGQAPPLPGQAPPALPVAGDDFDDEAEFSGSDDEERAEWERRKRERAGR